MRAFLRNSLPLLVLVVTGCAGNTAGSNGGSETADSTVADAGSARLVVANRTNLDMDIYALRSGSPVRVGFAPASENTTFKLNPALLAGAANVRFEARPNQRQGRSVVSEPFLVRAGEDITWDIPPQ